MDLVYHYPPELFELLVDGIPLLCRSKPSVISFFRGAGTPGVILAPLERRVNEDPDAIRKYEIVRQVLIGLNERGERALRERRDVLRRRGV